MMDVAGIMHVGNVKVTTTNYRGLSPEELAEEAMGRILDVRGNPPDAIRQQLAAFQGHLREVLLYYMRKAQQQERANIYGALMKNGAEDIAKIIRDM